LQAPTLSPIRVAPGGRYFETFDGEPFLFIGPNDAITWQGLKGLVHRKDVASAEGYLESLAVNGITIIRLMLEYAHRDGTYFEKPVGRFNPAMVRLWDDLFALCERYRLRVLLAPWDNFWLARRWHKHPYNVINGGPAHGPGAFFTDEATIQATERRLRFVAERWGGSGALAAWDLFNEIDPYWGGGPAEQIPVIARLSEAIRETEMRVWGFTRPQTVSIYGPNPGPYEELIFRHPSLDFATTHIYHKGPIDHPKNTVASAVTMAEWVRFGLTQTPPDRPFTDTEHGPIHLFNDHKKMLPEVFDEEYERHMNWAHLATGGAGSGMRWPARHPHILPFGMKRALRSLAGFTKLIDWRHFSPKPAAEDVTLGVKGWLPFACHDGQQAVVWLLRDVPKSHKGPLPQRDPQHEVSFCLRNLRPGAYSVKLWNTLEGREEGCLVAEAKEDGALRTVLPVLGNDLALAVRPEGATTMVQARLPLL
jgi:mannan endo-1,4-beta-mannosidase